MTIKLLHRRVLRARRAPLRTSGAMVQCTHLVGQGSGAGTQGGAAPQIGAPHPHPTQSAEASEIKFHGWVHRDSNSSCMCLWLEEEIRFD